MFFGTLDSTDTTIRQTSKLYSLKPQGIGTPLVESLTSLTVRQAQAHTVSTYDLVTKEIAPHIPNHQSQRKGKPIYVPTWWQQLSRSMNSAPVLTINWVGILEKLTGVENLQGITLAPWANIVQGFGTLRAELHWCPDCYEEWRLDGKIIYSPLLWSFLAVKVCPVHNHPLRQRCPFDGCGRISNAINSRSIPGCCDYCHRWLGGALPVQLAPPVVIDLEEELFIAQSISEVLATIPDLNQPFDPKLVTAYLNVLVALKGIKGAMNELNIVGPTGLLKYRRGQVLPINILLKLSKLIGIPLRNILCDDPQKYYDWYTEALGAGLVKPKRPVRKFDEVRVKADLESGLAEVPPPSLIDIAKRVDHASHVIKRHFPELSTRLTQRYADYRRGKTLAEDRAKNPGHRRVLNLDHIHQALVAAIESTEVPPVTVKAIALQLNCATTSLWYRYHDLSQTIADRHKRYISAKRDERRKRIYKQVYEAVLPIHEQGIKPTTSHLEKAIGGLRRDRIAMEAYNQIMQELGYEK